MDMCRLLVVPVPRAVRVLLGFLVDRSHATQSRNFAASLEPSLLILFGFSFVKSAGCGQDAQLAAQLAAQSGAEDSMTQPLFRSAAVRQQAALDWDADALQADPELEVTAALAAYDAVVHGKSGRVSGMPQEGGDYLVGRGQFGS